MSSHHPITLNPTDKPNSLLTCLNRLYSKQRRGTTDEILQTFLLLYWTTPNRAVKNGLSRAEALMGQKLPTTLHNRSKSMKHLTEITENCFMWIWNKRNVPWTCHSITCSQMHNNILTCADLKIYISPLDVDLIGCFNGASCQWGGPMCK